MIIYIFFQRHVTIVPFSEGYAHREGMVSGVIIMNSLHQLSSLFSWYLLTRTLLPSGDDEGTGALSRMQPGYVVATQWRLPTAISLQPAAGDSILFAGASCHTTCCPSKEF